MRLVICRLVFAAVMLGFVLAPVRPCSAADGITGMVDLELGKNVEDYAARIDLDHAVSVWGRAGLKRADLGPIGGYRSGSVTFGTCAAPGRILRIKLSYEEDSERFFNWLVGELRERYGKSPENRGDPFGTLKAWKWSVKSGRIPPVSLIVQHYTGDDDAYTQGNSIRLSVPKWIDEEVACMEKKEPATPEIAPLPEVKSRNWYLPQ